MKKKLALSPIVFLFLFVLNVQAAEILGIHFAPDKEAHKPIIALYDGAEKTIHLAIFLNDVDKRTCFIQNQIEMEGFLNRKCLP